MDFIKRKKIFIPYVLKAKVLEFKNIHAKNPSQIKGNFIARMVTMSNDCFRLKSCFLNIRDKYDKFMDRDEIGGPNDAYEGLANKILRVSDLWYVKDE